MFPSSETRRRGWMPLLGAALVLTGLGVAQPGQAAPVNTGPVIDFVAPVLDIQFGESDLKSETRVEQSPKQTKITLDSTVLFGKDSATINGRAEGKITEVATRLKARGPGSVRITGYTDDLGSAASGKTLSKRRADAVAGLLRKDLPEATFPFTIVGKGEDDPAVPNTSEKNRKVNRRVVLVYQKS